ncbi:ATP-binding protein [Thiothrix nivea]|uniref:histidine kinase n=1 Tax=Thiothrix nivea (strain ATCC 35100 / DSM 5205 / JP2) TaxID=870187 RepID=A0A656HGY6_THINJ|nr:ATP-binding protein [Thiothrix nivea]EIJ34459.1 integral membrane sensor signal transduction histidine kinase [Thiothrix nivea DSM 5205]
MSRLFLTLFLLMLLVVIGFGMNINGVAKYLFNGTLEALREQQMGGVISLLENEIRGLDAPQRQQRLADIQAMFRYEVSLLPIAEMELSASEQQRLRNGEFVNRSHDQAEFSYHPAHLPGMAWRLQLDYTLSEGDRDFLVGPLALVEKLLAAAPPAQWSAVVAENAQHFGIPIQLLTVQAVQENQLLDEKQLAQLQAGEIAMRFRHNNLEYAFKRLLDSDQVLQIGRIEVPWMLDNSIYFLVALLSMLLGTAIWLWLHPLWQDLRKLRQAADGFGQGNLATRIDISRFSFVKSILEAFNSMARRIEQLVTSHQTLTNAVSHELRTPVSRLRFSLEMLGSTHDETDRQRHLQAMNTDIDELEEMLAELLTYARMDRQGISLNKTPLVLGEWLEEQIHRNQQDCQAIRIHAEGVGLPTAPVTAMDARLMTHALRNLLQNACRYANQQIQVVFAYRDGKHELRVEDDGCGIPEKHHDSIFDPFTRVDASRDRRSGGYGLGLAIVRQVMHMHQGNVTVGHSPLGGAQFVLRW